MSTAHSARARARIEVTAAIKDEARRQLAAEGAAKLSLRAVARELGMVSSALYRYFPSRDDLLTALIIDAYNAVGAAVESTEAGVDRADLRGRLLAIGHAVRGWALANPAEYALIYGSPVPGYAAPQDTTVAALRTATVLVRILGDGSDSGALRPTGERLDDGVQRDLTAAADSIAPGLDPDVLARGTIAWIHLFGAVSFELFGQLNNVIEAREAYFDYQMRSIADLVGV
jgi:AcrR family transcriptional regulator